MLRFSKSAQRGRTPVPLYDVIPALSTIGVIGCNESKTLDVKPVTLANEIAALKQICILCPHTCPACDDSVLDLYGQMYFQFRTCFDFILQPAFFL